MGTQHLPWGPNGDMGETESSQEGGGFHILPWPCSAFLQRTLTLWRHEQVHTLQHIQEELVPAILDALSPPADLPSHLAGDLRLLFFCLYVGGDTAEASLLCPVTLPVSVPTLFSSLLSSLHPVIHLPLQSLKGAGSRPTEQSCKG